MARIVARDLEHAVRREHSGTHVLLSVQVARLNIATDGAMHVDAEYLVVIATKNR